MQILTYILLFLVAILVISLLFLILWGIKIATEVIINIIKDKEYLFLIVYAMLICSIFIVIIMAILDPSIIKQEIRDDFNKSIYYIKSNL